MICPYLLNRAHFGDALELAKYLPDESVNCIVTSPAYFGLRDYGVEGQWGLEATPEEYVDHLVGLFRELRRALRADGTCWVNLGDSYCGSGPNRQTGLCVDGKKEKYGTGLDTRKGIPGLKSKDLVGIPWLVAFTLRADGWYLRSDIIWHKTNPMPEAVRDRPTKAHEYLFLLTKSKRYFYDAEAVREKSTGQTGRAADFKRETKEIMAPGQAELQHRTDREPTTDNGFRNKRSVWTVATQPYSGAHFATFPPKLIEPCILAGTSERGCCSRCGAPMVRIVEKQRTKDGRPVPTGGWEQDAAGRLGPQGVGHWRFATKSTTVDWQPSCDCNCGTAPCIVLDPFIGSGTTGQVAQRLGRQWIGFDIDPKNRELIEKRTAQQGLFTNARIGDKF